MMQRPYSLNPLNQIGLGCVVRGIDLSKEISQEVVQCIKEDTATHRLLVFKDQPTSLLSGARHVVLPVGVGDTEAHNCDMHVYVCVSTHANYTGNKQMVW